MTQSTMRLTVNGKTCDVDAAPDTALLYVLRNDLALNGPKYGCGLGECGACAVLIDGEAARSCVIPIEGCAGRDIVTLEGLGSRAHPDPVQEAFITEQAAQCGYCLNGMIISTKALLTRNAASFRGRGDGSAAPQSLPMRRAYRDHARGDAGGGPCSSRPATDGNAGQSFDGHALAGIAVGCPAVGLRRVRDLHQDHIGRFGHCL